MTPPKNPPKDPPKNKHLSTLAVAKAAMGQIATHGQAADPRSYELWYKFATGDSGLCAPRSTAGWSATAP
jgi:hypothetical protein